ncbi:hypothetical protein M8C13_10825 [Crossiella sp. SN42]|uniref:hypothetical protein n=1 Tax=unclassified Crossiella TaxID=2620835 RepID=UPI00207C196B|nr:MULTISPECIES: hypothetical protein [unclassified Crossiella]MCO1576247.1 hypothetical protein [Crossiella sp. SN42]WHT15879.1 hypothetical protein N8J89_22380 [Crossiella sp. CA-258035]
MHSTGSGGDVVSVNFSQLAASSDALSNRANALERHMHELDGSLGYLRNTWYRSGSAAGAQAQQAENDLRSAIAEMVAVIRNFSANTGKAMTDQMAMERTNAGLFPSG